MIRIVQKFQPFGHRSVIVKFRFPFESAIRTVNTRSISFSDRNAEQQAVRGVLVMSKILAVRILQPFSRQRTVRIIFVKLFGAAVLRISFKLGSNFSMKFCQIRNERT